MKYIVVLAICLFFQLSALSVGASDELILRGLSAVPVSGSEWIAVENVTGATVSAQTWSVRDVQGSVKSWVIPEVPPYELVIFSSALTKISLNNTGDQIELLQGGEVRQVSAPYEDLSSGDLWVLLGNVWQVVTQEDWERRWPLRDWVSILPSPTPVSSPGVSPIPSPKITPSPSRSTPSPMALGKSPEPLISPSPLSLSLDDDASWWDQVVLPSLGSLQSKGTRTPEVEEIWEKEPGDFSQEEERFRAWKRKILFWLTGMNLLSTGTVVMTAFHLIRCYNEACQLADGLSQ